LLSIDDLCSLAHPVPTIVVVVVVTGASDSKNYWMHAARRSGMVNTEQGIEINDKSRAAAARIPPFGTNSDTTPSLQKEREDTTPLVIPEDKELFEDSSQYLYFLFSHAQRIRLTASEQVGNRKSLRLGLPGFGCRYCCQAGRLGLSRIFPARRRTLPSKIPDLADHLRRCTLCPDNVKETLQQLQTENADKKQTSSSENQDNADVSLLAAAASTASHKEREFFTRIWSRLGHGDRPEPADDC